MAAYAPYILMAAGTAANIAGQRQQQREQRSILNRALEDTAKTQKQGSQAVLEEAQKLSPQARQEALAQQEAQTYAQAQQDLAGRVDAGGTGAIIDTAGNAGNVSQDFARAKADKAISEGNRLMDVAREAAKVRAPSGVLQAEGQRFADLTGRLGSLYGTNRNMAQAAQLDAQNVDEPTWGKLGKLAATVGSVWAAGAGMGANAAANAGQYSLAGNGAQLGSTGGSGFWGNAARIRFGG